MPRKGTIPDDLAAIISALEEQVLRAESLVARLPETIKDAPSPEGGWGLAQTLDHLAKTNLQYIGAMRQAIAPSLHLDRHRRRGAIRPGFVSRWFISQMEPPVRRRFKAPESVEPDRLGNAREGLREFLGAQELVVELLIECKDLDLNGIRFVNPFVRMLRFTVGAGFLIMSAHNRRHLWQLERFVTGTG